MTLFLRHILILKSYHDVIPVGTAPRRELDAPGYLTPVKSQQPPEGSCTSPVAGQPEWDCFHPGANVWSWNRSLAQQPYRSCSMGTLKQREHEWGKAWIISTNRTNPLFFCFLKFYLEIVTLNLFYHFSIFCMSTDVISNEFTGTWGTCVRRCSFH